MSTAVWILSLWVVGEEVVVIPVIHRPIPMGEVLVVGEVLS
jgi:hypothetical protein